MKRKNGKKKLIILLLLLTLTTGCTKTLVDKKGNAVKNEVTGQNLTENILCRPTDKDTIKAYEKNKVNIDKLPECKDIKETRGKYEGLWTSIFNAMNEAGLHSPLHPQISITKLRSSVMPCVEWYTSGWNCIPHVRSPFTRKAAQRTCSVLPMMLNDSGASVMVSPCDIHTPNIFS